MDRPAAFRHRIPWLAARSPVIWPRDRSWFVGIPIYTFEIAIAGAASVVNAIVSEPKLNARRVSTDYELDGDD
jgi:hypothetical protein